MTKQEFQNLLDRYLTGDATLKEQQQVEKFYAALQETEEGWDALDTSRKGELQTEIRNAIHAEINHDQPVLPLPWKSYAYRMAIAAVIFMGIGAVYFGQQEVPPSPVYLTKTTSSGQKALVTLSDGSTVKLNAESTITYPDPLAADQRIIELRGEAFFDVTEDSKRPFIVCAHEVQTTVLGTSFDVNAYDADRVRVSLVSGKVRVHQREQDQEVFLKPGESVSYEPTSKELIVEKFDLMKLTAWKDGIIYLSEAGKEEVFEQLAKWYGVGFKYENEPTQSWDYSGQFDHMSLEMVLNTIGFSEGFNFRIEGKQVTIAFEN